VLTGLDRVRAAARKDKRKRFTALMHHITLDSLRESFMHLQRGASPGIDGVTWQQYSQGLENRLRDLLERVHRGTYRAQPSKRAYIPKADGKLRPLGIAALEDKIVQQAVVTVLNAVYEEDFLGFSYGFRPGRSAHNALDAIWNGIMGKKVNWVLDADICGFFDNISHEWMQKFVEHRIADSRINRLIQKWLRAGVSEDGEWSKTIVGTPQGSVISPLLANVFLHYVFDLWVQQWRSQRTQGDIIVVRYADDFVMGFQHRGEAEQFLTDLRNRFAKFGLSLHPDKTRLIEFGRYAADNRRKKGLGKPETFNFLGFTHVCGVTHLNRKFTILRYTTAKRLRARVKQVTQTLMQHRHDPVQETGKWLGRVMRGYFAYHAVPNNARRLNMFRTLVIRAWLRALRRRSQRGRRLTWERFVCLVEKYLPKVSILHPYPSERFLAKYPKQEPYAVVPHVRICTGGGRQLPSLP